jgi:hypothetical protein
MDTWGKFFNLEDSQSKQTKKLVREEWNKKEKFRE